MRLNACVRISNVIKPFLREVIRAGITLPRKVHEGPPGNVLPGPELVAIDSD